MTPIAVRTLLLVGAVSGVGGWALLDALRRAGAEPLPVPWTAPVAIALLAAVVLGAGRQVRRWVQGRRPRPLDPLVAARIVVLSKAAAVVGAALVGWYGAQAVLVLPDLVGARTTRFVLALVTAGTALLLAVAGIVAQRWCCRPPDDPDDAPGRDRPPAPSRSGDVPPTRDR